MFKSFATLRLQLHLRPRVAMRSASTKRDPVDKVVSNVHPSADAGTEEFAPIFKQFVDDVTNTTMFQIANATPSGGQAIQSAYGLAGDLTRKLLLEKQQMGFKISMQKSVAAHVAANSTVVDVLVCFFGRVACHYKHRQPELLKILEESCLPDEVLLDLKHQHPSMKAVHHALSNVPEFRQEIWKYFEFPETLEYPNLNSFFLERIVNANECADNLPLCRTVYIGSLVPKVFRQFITELAEYFEYVKVEEYSTEAGVVGMHDLEIARQKARVAKGI